MAKRAASMKVVKKDEEKKEELEPIENVFEEAKKLFLMTVETQIKTAARVDNLLNIRDLALNFWKDKGLEYHRSIAYLKKLQKVSIKAYEDILEESKKFDLDDFKKTEIRDYYESLVPKVDDITDEEELLQAVIRFLSIQPYGNKLVQMHQLIQQELAKRGEL